MPYANAEGTGSERGWRRTKGTGGEGRSGDGASGSTGDGGSGCASRSVFATAASPPEGPGCGCFDIAREGEQVEVEGPML
eukprot:2532374-Pleurochrysis_carterae.AAC.1